MKPNMIFAIVVVLILLMAAAQKSKISQKPTYTIIPKSGLKLLNDEIVQFATQDECANYMMKNGYNSADYGLGTCYLSKDNICTAPAAYEPKPDHDYIHRITDACPISKIPYAIIQKSGLKMLNDEIVPLATQVECARYMLEKGYNSADYGLGTCYLSKDNKCTAPAAYEPKPDHNYIHRNLADCAVMPDHEIYTYDVI